MPRAVLFLCSGMGGTLSERSVSSSTRPIGDFTVGAAGAEGDTDVGAPASNMGASAGGVATSDALVCACSCGDDMLRVRRSPRRRDLLWRAEPVPPSECVR